MKLKVSRQTYDSICNAIDHPSIIAKYFTEVILGGFICIGLFVLVVVING